MKNTSPEFLRKRKTLLILPLLVLPFLTLAFWSLGGGQQSTAAETSGRGSELNPQLPGARFKEDHLTKMNFYEQAHKDSLKLSEQIRNDPYYRATHEVEPDHFSTDENFPANGSAKDFGPVIPLRQTMVSLNSKHERVEDQLEKKLKVLQDMLQQNVITTGENNSEVSNAAPQGVEGFSGPVNQLESMMQAMSKGDGDDPELQQINSALEKILDIQYPDRVKQRLEQAGKKKDSAIPLPGMQASGASQSYFGSAQKQGSEDVFFSWSREQTSPFGATVSAVVHGTQTISEGSTVKLRLKDDLPVEGKRVPANSFIWGKCALEADRVIIKIQTVRCGPVMLPVRLSVYDVDGLEGIKVPANFGSAIAGQTAQNVIQNLELSALDPTLRMQAATTGINMVKSLVSKKVKQVKLTLKAGYHILIQTDSLN
jgi:conjugative transposon TraM protein